MVSGRALFLFDSRLDDAAGLIDCVIWRDIP